MAKKITEKLPRPELPPPVNTGSGGKIVVLFTGRGEISSSDSRVKCERQQ